MKFLIINTDYPEFLQGLYKNHHGLENKSYDEQMRKRNESLFGVADFYSSNLRKLGHEAWDIHANNKFIQKAWAREHGICFKESSPFKYSSKMILESIATKASLTYFKSFLWTIARSLDSWFYDMLEEQVKFYKPDILFNHAMSEISPYFLKKMKPYIRLLMGQHAATCLSDIEDFSYYDLFISSFPPTIDFFRQKSIPAELNRLGFEPKVLSILNSDVKNFDVTFVGSFHSVHTSRVAFLESLCARFPQIKIWGNGIERLSSTSPIKKNYIGHAWGREMYQILSNSKIALNHHGDIPPYANNMRLFEATGVGTMLITDWKKNLHEMFEPGKEVVTYRSAEECAELIKYYLEHDNELETIASAGQERTLREHTYYQRMQELVDIVHKYL
ncbi:MAG: glycosyltransferase family 1 protein [Nitrospinae bacterium]|nr:glycosyltransferase family 1 protein [Nitrospinota bacterium]MBI3814191.1 glycosyltransferase family 1 protein [Nitrospinota bacterium]